MNLHGRPARAAIAVRHLRCSSRFNFCYAKAQGKTMRFLAGRLWPCILFLSAALPFAALAASQKSVVMPLLPLPTWTLKSEEKLSLQDLTRFGDQATVDKELGVTSAGERVYSRRDMQAGVIFEEAADPSSAYALYTLYQSSGFAPVSGVQLAVIGPKFALMARGRYLFRVLRDSNPAMTDADVRSLLIAVGGERLSVENLQSLPQMLPQRGLEPGTEKYLLGPESAKLALPSFPASLIGFEDGVEAHLGAYRLGGAKMNLLQIDYPTPQIAESHFQAMAKALHINEEGQSTLGRKQGTAPIYGSRHGSLALLVLGAPSQAAAEAFLGRFKTRQIVTEAPEYPRKDNFAMQMVDLVLANGELVVILCILGILGGVLIFLTKQLIMKLFPKSGLIRADDDILIRLKIS